MTTKLLGDIDRARRALQQHIRALEEPRRNTKDDSPIEVVDVQHALWELSYERSFHDGYHVDFVADKLRAALEGKFQPIRLGYWATQFSPYPDLRLTCVAIEFEPGSLRSKLKLVGASTALVLTLMVSAGGPLLQEQYERYRVAQEVSMIYGAERCITNAEMEIDGRVLLDALASDLNFNAPGISPEQRQRAVCLSQLALDLSGFPIGPIDGIYGPVTEKQHRAFAKAKGYGDVQNQAVSRLLAEALHVGARRLVTK
jgi:hypothetical protein